jgi:modulator of FtsH protease
MDPYRPEVWHDFFIAMAGASAALTGLLFVGLSMHIRYIASDAAYRQMARGSLLGLLAVLVLSMVVLVHQPASWAGIELALIGALFIVAQGGYELMGFRRARWRVPRSTLVRVGGGQLLALLGVIAGVGIVFEAGPGLYAAALVSFVIVVWSLWNAWVLLIVVADQEIAADTPKA